MDTILNLHYSLISRDCTIFRIITLVGLQFCLQPKLTIIEVDGFYENNLE